MIVVDTSALVAIAFAEPEREAFSQAIRTAGKSLISTVCVVETRMVVHGRRGQRAVILVDDLLRLPLFELVAPGPAETFGLSASLRAVTYGREARGSRNFGCFPRRPSCATMRS